jgi:hypothetical protein
MPVTVTVGTNSYIDVADAQAYFDERLYSDAWESASDDDKAKALIMATKKLDRQTLKGAQKTEDQTLQFPRCYVGALYQSLYPGHTQPLAVQPIIPAAVPTAIYGWLCESDVPQAVLDAVCEEALALLDRGNSKRRKMQQEGVTSFGVGTLHETYATGRTGRSVNPNALISVEARELLTPYLAGSVRIV